MSYKKLSLLLFGFFYVLNCFPQGNIEKKGRLYDDVTERYHVSPAEPLIKDGLYQAFYRRNKLVAEGTYTNGKKTGVWNFYNPRKVLMQTMNFDKDSIQYEVFENRLSDFHYFVDKQLTDSDKTRKPMKIGGRYFGYLPYLNMYKTPFDAYNSSELYTAVVELLISPLGRLAEYKVRVFSSFTQFDQTVILSLKLFREEDKQFIPAKVNGKPVLSRILIKCKVTDDGGLDFF